MSERKGIARLFGRRGEKAVIDEAQWAQSSSASISSYGSGYLSYAKLYRSQPAVRQVVSFIAENMAQVPIDLFRKDAQDIRIEVDDHPVARVLEYPNDSVSSYEFIRDLVTDLEVFDHAYWQIGRANGEIALARIQPDAVTPKGVGPFGPSSYVISKSDGTTVELDAVDVLDVSGYGGGISPMETLRRILAEDEAAGQYREGMYRNGMRNAGVIERPLEAPDWSEKARQRFLEQLTDRHTGADATGRPLLLEEGMTWKSDQIAMASQEYIASREFTTRVVANMYRISPAILGLTDAPYASITAYNQQLYQNALAPRMVHIVQSIERQLLTKQERVDERLYLEFNLSAKLRGSFQEQAAIAQMAVGKPYMTVDEYRAIYDLPPMEQGEAGPRFADVGLPALVQAGIVSPAWAAEQVGAPTEGMSTVPAPQDPNAPADTSPPGGAEGGQQTGAGATDQPSPSEDSVVPKSKASRVDRAYPKRHDAFASEVAAVIAKTLERAAKAAPNRPFTKARLEDELAADLQPVIERHTVAEASAKAAELGAKFDPRTIQNYVEETAKNQAVRTAGAMDAIQKRYPEDDDASKEARKTALSDESVRSGLTMATAMLSFARMEAAKAANVGTKTWSTTTEDSRHADVDGETVALGKQFSNGLRYPGDPAGDAGETVNCLCVLDIS